MHLKSEGRRIVIVLATRVLLCFISLLLLSICQINATSGNSYSTKSIGMSSINYFFEGRQLL